MISIYIQIDMENDGDKKHDIDKNKIVTNT